MSSTDTVERIALVHRAVLLSCAELDRSRRGPISRLVLSVGGAALLVRVLGDLLLGAPGALRDRVVGLAAAALEAAAVPLAGAGSQ